MLKNIDWKDKLSNQLFDVNKNDIIFGFSLGAVLAWLVAQNNECKHIILASMTPKYYWKDKKIKKSLIDITGKDIINDIVKNLKPKHLAKKETIIYGDKEGESADIVIPDTDHELNERYIKEVGKLI